MKTVTNLFFLATTLLPYACAKEDEGTKIDPIEEFTVSSESYNSSGTKTSMNSNREIIWSTGDSVAVWATTSGGASGKYKVYSGGKTTASLTLEEELDMHVNYANIGFYPYASSLYAYTDQTIFIVSGANIPSTQSYRQGTFLGEAFPMVAASNDKVLAFKNILGVIRFNLKKEGDKESAVRRIRLIGNNGEYLAGSADIYISSNNRGEPRVGLQAGSVKSITLDCGEEGVPLTDDGVDFYITLPPTTFDKGFHIDVTDTRGVEITINTDSTLTLERSTILNMEAKGVYFEDPYITFISEGTSTLAMNPNGEPDVKIDLEYSTDAVNWNVWEDISNPVSYSTLYLRGKNSTFASGYNDFYHFVMGGDKASCSGDIMNLLNYEQRSDTIPSAYCFVGLFKNCDLLTRAPSLPAKVLTEWCYCSMFDNCRSLLVAPTLPATKLASCCYESMFIYCTSMEHAPLLPATVMAEYCYYCMFYGCTSFVVPPELPATKLAQFCYAGMFERCTSLERAPELPAREMASYCYLSMFSFCISLTEPPVLPAKLLASHCYGNMFYACTGLTSAPALPATQLMQDCYSYMFDSCISLVSPPVLPATQLAEDCYYNMFRKCKSLATAPALPATTMYNECYSHMFEDCPSLTTAPALPATSLSTRCYYSMFSYCTALQIAPVLPATTLVTECYYNMFYGCSSLRWVICLALDKDAENCTYHWLDKVADGGVFTCHEGAVWERGTGGVPESWLITLAVEE